FRGERAEMFPGRSSAAAELEKLSRTALEKKPRPREKGRKRARKPHVGLIFFVCHSTSWRPAFAFQQTTVVFNTFEKCRLLFHLGLFPCFVEIAQSVFKVS